MLRVFQPHTLLKYTAVTIVKHSAEVGVETPPISLNHTLIRLETSANGSPGEQLKRAEHKLRLYTRRPERSEYRTKSSIELVSVTCAVQAIIIFDNFLDRPVTLDVSELQLVSCFVTQPLPLSELIMNESFLQNYHVVNRLLFSTNVKPEAVDMLKDFPVRADDTWITTYPKSGTTWMQHIVTLILNRRVSKGEDLDDLIPWLEYFPAEFDRRSTCDFYDSLKLATSPRVFKSHYSYDTMPYGSNLPATRYRCIYVARNPKDVAVSYYHHVFGFTLYSYKPSWDELFDHFLKGEVDGGDWFDHVLSFWAHKDDDNILFLKYEDMKKDLPAAVAAVAKFMGHDLAQEVIDAIVKQSEFKAMKDSFITTYSSRDPKAAPFIRKGVVGDWKNYFTPEQTAQFDAIYAERMKGTGLDFEFGDGL